MTDATQKPYDVFIASSERYQDQVHLRHAMIGALKSLHSFGAKERQNPIPSGPWEPEPSGDGGAVPIGGTRNASVKNLLQRALVMRICMALIASTLLIGPMWLLALKRDLIFDLGTTTVAVTVFGLLLAFVLDKRDQVFTGTLAYAAVLMVFVHLNRAPSLSHPSRLANRSRPFRKASQSNTSSKTNIEYKINARHKGVSSKK